MISLLLRKERDTDRDGITDRHDSCPDTPAGAGVDPLGCPTDQDRDGVLDGIDLCAQTPRGATVDSAGCPMDSDRDGVFDGIDLCPGTNPATPVNEGGCPHDSDGDGVPEGMDQCPDTPIGTVVDAGGCRVDSDGDGVPEGMDQCPETNLEDPSDESGCSAVQRGEPLLPTIRFKLASTTIDPASSPALTEVASLLKENPDILLEIGGHTDNEGPASANREFSLQRAEEVKAYLVSQGVPASRLITKGYGKLHPVASNRTAEGRAENRRIEFKVLPP